MIIRKAPAEIERMARAGEVVGGPRSPGERQDAIGHVVHRDHVDG